MTNAIHRVPALETLPIKKFFNGPEAFTPDARVHPRRVGGARVLGRRRVLRARPRRRRRHRQDDGRVDRRRPAGVGGLGARHPPLRRHLRARSATRWPAPTRRSRSTTTSSTRARSGRPAGRCASRRPTPRHVALGAAFGEKSGWERVNWYESNAAGGDESLRPRGWAGENWSPAIAAEAAATRTAAGLFDESSFAKIEVVGPGALDLLQRLCAQRRLPAGRPRHVHADAQRTAAASSATCR